MAIGYTGFSRLSRDETQRLIDAARAEEAGTFQELLSLSNVMPDGPFDGEIKEELGIDAVCRFAMKVLDKENLGAVDEALDRLQARFGSDNLTLTWDMDKIRPARLAD